MRILFGVMSAVQPARTVAALCDAIGDNHPILIHHDFSQQADFAVRRCNVQFVDDPVRTGWGNWAFTQGIQRLVVSAMGRNDWDFLQLVSPTCMPIRPIPELVAHLESAGADYLIDAVRLGAEARFLMSHGWRAYAPEGLWRHRALRRARRWYLGNDSPMGNHAGLSFPTASRLDAGVFSALKALVGLGLTKAAERGFGFDHIFSDAYPCYVGSNWFGASRRGCAYLLENTQNGPILEYFKRIHMPDEMLYATVFMNSHLKGAPAIHYLSRFIDARPSWIEVGDLDDVLGSGYYFARKFPEDVESAVRLELARRLSGSRTSQLPRGQD
ncbi:MAG: hypothetical protein H0T52_07485 [Lautropia sp.]|nr:hypothetical protein [Lautropia sp.]